MSDVTNIIWYGRGGQGAFTASKIIGAAYSLGSGHGYVYLDASLVSNIPADGISVINTTEKMDHPNAVTLDATKIATENKVPVVNTAMAGAVASLSGMVDLESLFIGIETIMPEKLWDRNKRVAEAAFRMMRP